MLHYIQLNPKAKINGMRLRPLGISVKRKTWRMSDKHASDHNAEFHRERSDAIRRDDFTCQFCGFKSTPNRKGSSFQESHHLDDDHQNNNPKNLATACHFCHMVHHIGFVGATKRGKLIYAPEIPQHYISHLCIAAIVMRAEGDADMNQQIEAMFNGMAMRALYLEKFIGKGASDPAVFGQALLMTDPKKVNQNLLSKIKLLPDITSTHLEPMANFFKEHSFKGLSKRDWQNLRKPINYAELITQIAENKKKDLVGHED